ncbi:MAG: efflux RND transporter periplasmic adaptor subunit [Bacteroidota bacterium]|nr:efflux RND transporter periplasmic adaptor subunit [Bacteroidota bacterium]
MKSIKFLIGSLFIALTVISCSNNKAQETAVVDNSDTGITDSLIKTLQTAPVEGSDQADIIKLNGKIQPNESLQAKVYSLVSGKIKDVHVELGDYVKKGQTLAIIQSTEVAAVTTDVTVGVSDVALAKKNLQVQQDLYQGKLATEQDYLAAKSNYDKALAGLSRARQISAINGGRNSSYVVTAPLSGYIIEKNVTNNSQVRNDNNTSLFSIANLSNVWIIANVYEADINNIKLGDEVKVNTLADPNKDYVGKIDKVYNVLDPATRTMKVRISMNNANGELKPEMFATIKVKNSSSSRKVLSIPSQAVVLDNSKNYVIVKQGNNLQVKQVEIVKRVDPKSFVSGLNEGDQVVMNSQVFLLQALNSK